MPTLPGLTGTFSTILIDPPRRFDNRTAKPAPEHRRLRRYRTTGWPELRLWEAPERTAKRNTGLFEDRGALRGRSNRT